jgi:dUTPase
VGIIDSGYRGDIIGVFDIINPNYGGIGDLYITMEKYTRLLQICSGDLKPFKVIILDTPECLGTTERGIGGFGSTGK